MDLVFELIMNNEQLIMKEVVINCFYFKIIIIDEYEKRKVF